VDLNFILDINAVNSRRDFLVDAPPSRAEHSNTDGHTAADSGSGSDSYHNHDQHDHHDHHDQTQQQQQQQQQHAHRFDVCTTVVEADGDLDEASFDEWIEALLWEHKYVFASADKNVVGC
jgi:G3E family GTPase